MPFIKLKRWGLKSWEKHCDKCNHGIIHGEKVWCEMCPCGDKNCYGRILCERCMPHDAELIALVKNALHN